MRWHVAPGEFDLDHIAVVVIEYNETNDEPRRHNRRHKRAEAAIVMIQAGLSHSL
jgi:hypothetical protein